MPHIQPQLNNLLLTESVHDVTDRDCNADHSKTDYTLQAPRRRTEKEDEEEHEWTGRSAAVRYSRSNIR